MERLRRTETDRRIRWKKMGGGSFRGIPNKIIKPGEIFLATPEQIPAAFRDLIIPLDPVPGEEPMDGVGKEAVDEVPSTLPITSNYTMKLRENSTVWYDVFDVNGKKINEKALRKDDAESLLNTLK